MIDACILVFRRVQPAPQRTAEGGQLKVVGAEQMAELAAPGLREGVGSERAGGVDLHAGYAEALGLLQGLAERQAERIEVNADLQALHG